MCGIKYTVGKDSEKLAALDSWNKNCDIMFVLECVSVMCCSVVNKGRSQWP